MVNPEVIKYSYRSIIELLDGNTNEFIRLATMAQRHNTEEMTCSNCGGVQIPCRIGQKRNMRHGHICTECGQVTIKGSIYRRGKTLWGRMMSC